MNRKRIQTNTDVGNGDTVKGVRAKSSQRQGTASQAAPLLLMAALALLMIPALAEQSKPFPQHWGNPPQIQTQDYIEWPDGYGHGSSTVAHWIKAHMAKDRAGGTSASEVLYVADFDTTPIGQLPAEFMVLNGDFGVREENGMKFMELPGTPLDSYAVMFGPAASENIAVSAKIQGTSKGRRHPSFGIGLNGLGGYRLRLSPAKRALELIKGPEGGGETVATAPFKWASGEWVELQLQVRNAGGDEWRVEGKAWMDGRPKPGDWAVSYVETQKPLPGRPFVAASPYSDTPIRFDALTVSKANK